MESLEGYASWQLVRDGAAARSRFSFLFVLPGRGLMEITDPLNRTVSRLILEGSTAYLVLPGKHAYWKADRPEVMTRILGFDISPEELSALLSGREQGLSGWSLEKDSGGRVIAGRRDSLTFSVGEFFDGGRLPRTAAFSNGTDQGRLRVLQLRFNQPTREEAFQLSFLDDARYRAVGWDEIEKWLSDED
jgi:outer membrane biogenesis lipoprotein LolB